MDSLTRVLHGRVSQYRALAGFRIDFHIGDVDAKGSARLLRGNRDARANIDATVGQSLSQLR